MGFSTSFGQIHGPVRLLLKAQGVGLLLFEAAAFVGKVIPIAVRGGIAYDLGIFSGEGFGRCANAVGLVQRDPGGLQLREDAPEHLLHSVICRGQQENSLPVLHIAQDASGKHLFGLSGARGSAYIGDWSGRNAVYSSALLDREPIQVLLGKLWQGLGSGWHKREGSRPIEVPQPGN